LKAKMLPLSYVTFFALPTFLMLAWKDFKTKKIDTRFLYAIIGLAYGGYFANGVSIFLALSVSISLILLQYANKKAKLAPWGSGDFPLMQAYGLLVMLYSPHIYLFVIFMLLLLILLGLWRWFTKDKSFAPSVAMAFLVFGFSKLMWI